MKQDPLVSICCVTYNHKKYIQKAIEGFLMQKTSFQLEIIINDDCSTDGTTEILKDYESQHPDLIKLVLHEVNEWSQGLKSIFARNTFSIAKGKYIALCEGDDYWTDPLKLQKQVDFLEENLDYNISYHDMKVQIGDDIRGDHLLKKTDKDLTFEDVLLNNYMHTPSICFRNVFKKYPDWFYNAMPGDHPLQMLLLFPDKKAHKLDGEMGVYRIHGESMWSSSGGEKYRLEKALTKIQIIDYFKIEDRAYILNPIYMLADLIAKEGYEKITKKKYRQILRKHLKFRDYITKNVFYLYFPRLRNSVKK